MHCLAQTRQNMSENCVNGCIMPIRKPKKRPASVQPSKKRFYNLIARSSLLHPGNRFLMRNVGLQRKQKLADRLKNQPYVVCRQPNENILVYVVKPDNTRSRKTRTLHRNLLLPFMSTLDWHTEEEDLFNAVEESQVDVLDIDWESDVSLPIIDAEILSDTDVSSLESRVYIHHHLHATGFRRKIHRAQICQFPTPSHQDQDARKPSWMNSKDLEL